MNWSTRVRAGALAVVMLVALSGCIKYEGEVKIDDDGSGTIDALIAMDGDSLLGSLAEFGMDDGMAGMDLCEEMKNDGISEIPPEAEVSDYDEDGFCGYRIKLDLEPSDDHGAIVGEFWGDEAANTELYKEGEEWVFSSLMDLGEITEDDMMPAEMMEMIFAEASIKLVIDLPGTPIDGEHNADTASDDGRFEWDVDLFNAPDRLFARTEPGGGGGAAGGILRTLAILAILAGLAALGWFLFKKFGSGDGVDSAIPSERDMGLGGPEVDADLTMPAAGLAASDLAPPPMPQPDVPAQPETDLTTPVADQDVTFPAADDQAVAETVAINPEDLDQGASGAADTAADPVWDEARGAWTIQDPTRGLLVHDPVTDSWAPPS